MVEEAGKEKARVLYTIGIVTLAWVCATAMFTCGSGEPGNPERNETMMLHSVRMVIWSQMCGGVQEGTPGTQEKGVGTNACTAGDRSSAHGTKKGGLLSMRPGEVCILAASAPYL